MFIKLQQKITKKISQFTIANSQQLTIILNLTLHIITNVHIKIIIFDKNEKLTLRKRDQSLKKHLIVFFYKINDVIFKKFERFQKNKIFVTITFKLSIVKNFQFSRNEQTITNQFFLTILLISLNELQIINQITSTLKNINTLIESNNDLKFNSTYVISNINFKFINNLIYHCKNKNNYLCIFNNCVQNVL